MKSLFVVLLLFLLGLAQPAIAMTCPTGQYERYYLTYAGSDSSWGAQLSSSNIACLEAQRNVRRSTVLEVKDSAESCVTTGGTTQYSNSGYVAKWNTMGLSAAEPANPGQAVFLQKNATRYRTSDGTEAGISNSYGLFEAAVFGECGADPSPTEECPQAGTRVPRVVGGLCIGAACEGNMMEEMCTSTLDDPTKGCIAKPVDIAIRKGQLSVGHYEFTGGTCNPYGEEYPTDHPVSDDPSTGAKCTVDPNNGTSLCVEENSNCGTFNGERVCASEAPSTGQCKKLVSGGYLCVQGASTPPAPDNGEEGQPAQPDGQLKKPGTGNSSGNTYNYYNSSTVNNSTGEGPGGTTGGTTGGGDGEDDEGGFGSPGEGWPELDEVPTFSETNETFLEGLQGTSLGQAMLAAAEGVPEGTISCVPPSFEYQNEVYTFDAMCELWTGHASLLRSFFILGWALVAVVVFMRA